jgi:hypothetical protein
VVAVVSALPLVDVVATLVNALPVVALTPLTTFVLVDVTLMMHSPRCR